MLIREITLRNLLSFGPDTPPLELRPLNVLIGPNGSGKSNFIEAISLFQSAPRLLADPVRDSGGIADWLWKGARKTTADLEAVIENPQGTMPLRHAISFTESGRRFELIDERIENERKYPDKDRPYFYYRFENNQPVLNVKGKRRALKRENVDPEQSILSQRKDPDQYPEISYLGDCFGRIRIYREWSFGRYSAPRLAQKADDRNDSLKEDCSNLGLVLNRLRRDPDVKARLLGLLGDLYEQVTDFDVIVEGGTVQVFFQEGRQTIPATRLSDGTLRYLCLLAILCHPEPPPLICIEEPELGLHPDALLAIAKLIEEASERTQLIITTHSQFLVDYFTHDPEAVIVCEKGAQGTTMKRLDAKELGVWLENYSLGDLWSRGQIGGNRW